MNYEQQINIRRLIILAVCLFVFLPASLVFYKNTADFPVADGTKSDASNLTNANIMDDKLKNGVSETTKKSIEDYASRVGMTGNIHIVNDQLVEKSSSYQFYVASKNEKKQFRVDVILSGFDTSSVYVNGVRQTTDTSAQTN